LLKDDRKADETKPAPVDAVHTEVDERRRGRFAQTSQIVERATCLFANAFQVSAIDLEVTVVVRKVAERTLGPEPLADHGRINVGERFIDAPADERSEVHEERKRLHGNAGLFKRRLQERKLK